MPPIDDQKHWTGSRIVGLEDLDRALHLALVVAVAACIALLEVDHQLFHGAGASGRGP